MEKKSIWKSYRFSIILILSIIIGSLIGAIFGEKAMVLKPFGDLFINLMFTIVVPLVFATIASSISNMSNMKRLGKIIRSMLVVFVVTGLIASVIILFVVKMFPPADGVNIVVNEVAELKTISTGDQIVKTFTVTDFTELISRRNMLPLIIFTIFFGFCVNAIGESGKVISNFLSALSKTLLKMIGYIMYYAPIGLGAYFAALVGEYGKELIGSYTKAMLIYYPLCILYILIFFPIYAYISGGKEGVKSLKYVLSPAVTAIATQSSIATLPVNIEACENIGVPKDVSDIVLPIGATAHMDGTVIGTILKISFLFGVFNIPFTGISTYFTAILLSIAGGVVMSGIPGGGLIGEMLIVSIYGFPPEAFPIVATIGYLIDPPATMINAAGDTVASMLVARMVEGKNWLLKKGEKNV
ncbi:dicarboxylate/amino acid:cation symporter [Streptobacillus moniliformis]|uniref:Sodium:dicarboxylate symporter n=1 Tax=Streptobacillus moniliformis (strain ATCC 14647 / DSM 12112 / NCTC 10651 / 9901) TaxID=519441 RepID=D1AWG9_STRM9|nr:dicarboxylate/amino acid:cation symporter [Streptobacillus moniliformis]ACZ00645.1 sodium:dicarboxylate symporter [Streptobacillus moniliformis DSM 12112]AVL42944.1 dicarboxylate/amino acid:cation symporter [Streptobacillus moniliformis]SQA14227.1 Aerobic C4-dicarboxylate transport protein [Streptobacillus moniliformis]